MLEILTYGSPLHATWRKISFFVWIHLVTLNLLCLVIDRLAAGRHERACLNYSEITFVAHLVLLGRCLERGLLDLVVDGLVKICHSFFHGQTSPICVWFHRPRLYKFRPLILTVHWNLILSLHIYRLVIVDSMSFYSYPSRLISVPFYVWNLAKHLRSHCRWLLCWSFIHPQVL